MVISHVQNTENRNLPRERQGRTQKREKRDRKDRLQCKRTSKRGVRKKNETTDSRERQLCRWWRERGRLKGIARRKSEAHVRRRNEGADEETGRGDIKSGPPKLRRNGGSSSSRHPWAEYSCISVIKLPDSLRILLVAVLKNYRVKYLKFPLIAQTSLTPLCILFDRK